MWLRYLTYLISSNNAKDCQIEGPYREIRDLACLDEVNYTKTNGKIKKFSEKTDYEHLLDNNYYENCYDSTDHEDSEKSETEDDDSNIIKV